MDITPLERLIVQALADLLRAQHKAVPALDTCVPGMVDDEKRQQIRTAQWNLAEAFAAANAARDGLGEASRMLAHFLIDEEQRRRPFVGLEGKP